MFLFLFGCTDNAIKVVNSIPTATITSHSNEDTVLEGYPTIFFAELADTNHKSTDLLSTWKAGDTEFCIDLPPDESGRSTCEIRIVEGMEEVSIQVSDPANDTSQTAIFVKLIPNENPTVEISSPNDDALYYVDSKVDFSGKIGDAEDSLEELLYSWSSDLVGELNFVNTMDSEGNLSGGIFLEEGSHTITLFVEDVGLKSTAATVDIIILPPNQSPECELTDVNQAGFLFESPVSLFGTTTDPELANEKLTVTWTSNLDGELGPSIPTENGTVSFTTSSLSVGTHLITLQASDEMGRTCSAEQEVYIGTAPTVSITAITEATVGEGATISLQATVGDAQQSAETLLISWSSSVQGELSTVSAESSGTSLLALPPFTLLPNGHIITLTATDELGFSTSDQVSFTVNSGPSIPLLSLSPSFVLSEDDVTAVAQGSNDAEGDAVTYLYEWKKDGVTTTDTTEMISFDQTQRDEIWEVIVTAIDMYGLGQNEALTFTVLNSPPNIDSISLDPASEIHTQSTVLCAAMASDIDTEVDLDISYTWTINASPIGTNASLTLSNAVINVGDTLECTAIATDDRGLTDETSMSVEIINRSPTINYVEIIADPAFNVQALLNCVVSADDPEQEDVAYHYAWYQNGDLLPLEIGSQLQLSQGWVSFSDEFECQVYVQDPHEAISPTESDSVLILDAPPQVNNIFLSPAEVFTDTEITANVNVVDPEGAQPTYTCRWLVNDIEVYAAGCILDGNGYFEKNDRVKVGVLANDGIQDGTETFSSEIVISNTKPSDPEISMTPQPVHQGIEDMTCRVTEASEDTDINDVLVYTARWYIDEQEVFDEVIDAETSSILDASYTLEHDSIRCNIEVFDGDETAIVSATANIDRYFEIYREDFGGTEGGRTWSFHFTPPTDGVILFEYLNSDSSADGTVKLESDVGGVRLELFAGWRSEVYQGETAVPVTDRMAASNIFAADGDHWFSVNYSLSDDETSNPSSDLNTFIVTYIPNESLDVATSTALDISNFSQCATCCHAPFEAGDFDMQLASGYNFGVSAWVLFEATDCGNAGGGFGFYTPNTSGLSSGSDAWARFEVGYPQLCNGDGLVAYSVPSGYYDIWVAHKDDNCSDNTGIRAGNFYSMTWSP